MAKTPVTPPADDADASATPTTGEPAEVISAGDTEVRAFEDADALREPVAAWSPGVVGAAASGPQGLRGRVREAWASATSTTSGRVATTVAAVLGTLALIAAVGLGIAALGRDRDRGPWARGGQGQNGAPGQGGQGHGAPGQGGQGQGGIGRHQANDGHGYGMGQGGHGAGGSGRHRANDGHDQEMGQGWGVGPGMGGPSGVGPGTGMSPNQRPNLPGGGAVGDGAAGLAGILHGEFVTALTGSATAILFQTGEVTDVTAGKSVTVTSVDGFSATYTLTELTAYGRGGAPALVKGATVTVLATKKGATATRVAVRAS